MSYVEVNLNMNFMMSLQLIQGRGMRTMQMSCIQTLQRAAAGPQGTHRAEGDFCMVFAHTMKCK